MFAWASALLACGGETSGHSGRTPSDEKDASESSDPSVGDDDDDDEDDGADDEQARPRADGGARDASRADAEPSDAIDAGEAEPDATTPSDAQTARDASRDAAPDGGGGGDEPDAAPPVDLPSGVKSLSPRPNARGVCNDPPLRIEFDAPPSLGARGRVQVWEEGKSTAAVTIDLAAGAQKVTRGGQSYVQPPPAHVDGNAALFALPPGALARGKRYHVTIEEGALRGPKGGFSIRDAETFRFETAPSGPADPGRLTVDVEAAPFCTVQAAVDAVPANNQTPTTIEIGEGTYFGLVHWKGKNKLKLRGKDRARTKLVGINNENLNGGTRARSLFGVEASSDVTIENLTIHNLTPQGGSQAEALALLDCDRCVVRDANILSLQDTLLWTGRIYAENCYVAGNVDFVWGYGTAFFKGCEIKTVGRSGYIVQARNGADKYGYVFVDSKISGDPGVSSVFARIDAAEFPSSHVAFVDCEVGPHITAAGWTVTNPARSVRFWEYGSKDAAGRPLSTAGRSSYSRQLTASEAAKMRDPREVLRGWAP